MRFYAGPQASGLRTGGLMNVGDLVSVEELEREHIRLVMNKTKNLGEAARVLGIDAATLYRKRKRWGLDKDASAATEAQGEVAHAHAHADATPVGNS